MLNQLDHALLARLYGGSHGAWAWLMIAMTILGSGWASAGLLPLWVFARSRRLAAALSGAIALQSFLVWLLKRETGRLRPWLELGLPAPIGAPHDGSFPSGHAAGSFCVAAFLVVVLRARPERRWARAAIAACVVLAALIALSRVYLGAHFPADVVAGAALGGCIGAAAARLYASAPARSGARP